MINVPSDTLAEPTLQPSDVDDGSAPCGEELVVTLTSQQRFKIEGTTAMQKLVAAIHEEQQWADGLASRASGLRLHGKLSGGDGVPLLSEQSGSKAWEGDANELMPRPVHVATY